MLEFMVELGDRTDDLILANDNLSHDHPTDLISLKYPPKAISSQFIGSKMEAELCGRGVCLNNPR